jgi:hypothetical protein
MVLSAVKLVVDGGTSMSFREERRVDGFAGEVNRWRGYGRRSSRWIV